MLPPRCVCGWRLHPSSLVLLLGYRIGPWLAALNVAVATRLHGFAAARLAGFSMLAAAHMLALLQLDLPLKWLHPPGVIARRDGAVHAWQVQATSCVVLTPSMVGS
jgi:hypothetical protein